MRILLNFLLTNKLTLINRFILRQGQIVIICYAMIGIPFFLMTTAKISLMLAGIFSFVYENFILFPCNCMKMNLKKKNNIVNPEQPEGFIDHTDGF